MFDFSSYNVFDCYIDDSSFVTAFPDSVMLAGRIKAYDQMINQKINELYSLIYGIYDSCMSNNCAYKTNIENLVNELQDPKYQNYFSTYFNEYKSYPDEYFTSDYIYALRDLIESLQAKFPEYYLMAKTISKYDCCYLETLRFIFDFSNQFLFSGTLLCPFNSIIKNYLDQIDAIINYINENDDITIKYQRTADSYSSLLTANSIFEGNVIVKRDSLLELMSYIKRFFAELPAYLKAISITQIILSSDSKDDPRFEKFSQVLLDNNYTEPQEDENFRVLSQITKYYESNINKYGIPAILNTKQFLKSDWSNFNSLSSQIIINVADLAGIGNSGVCPVLHELLAPHYN